METKTFKPKGLVSYFGQIIERRRKANLNCFNYDISLKHLETFSNGNEILFNVLSADWFDGFKKYLSNAKGLRSEKKLGHNSVSSYFSILTAVAKEAANDGFIDHKIVNGIINTGSRKQSNDPILSFDEIQKLAYAPCHPVDLKTAFLFSCLTGLQWKDIDKLKWKHFSVSETDEWFVTIGDEGERNSIPVSVQARQLLGVGGHPERKVFSLHYTAALCVNLNKWALKAGITRNIKFQTARQSFGKLLLDQGVDIELISELLGHKHIKTTTKFLAAEIRKPIVTSDYLRTFNV
jgi:integrase